MVFVESWSRLRSGEEKIAMKLMIGGKSGCFLGWKFGGVVVDINASKYVR